MISINKITYDVARVASVGLVLFLQACGGSDPPGSIRTDDPAPTSPVDGGDATDAATADGAHGQTSDASTTDGDRPPGACAADPTKDSACKAAPLPRPSPHYFHCTPPAVPGATCTEVGQLLGGPGGTASTTFWCCE